MNQVLLAEKEKLTAARQQLQDRKAQLQNLKDHLIDLADQRRLLAKKQADYLAADTESAIPIGSCNLQART